MSRASQKQRIQEAEWELLLDVAGGKKTFEQAAKDARKFSYKGHRAGSFDRQQRCKGHHQTNGITNRHQQTQSDPHTHSPEEKKAQMPQKSGLNIRFSLVSDRIERILKADPNYFDIELEAADADVVASDFLHSQEYNQHPLVQQCANTNGNVIPVSVYSDGVSVSNDPFQDTVYTMFASFLHRGMDEQARPMAKHTLTV